MKNEKQIRHEIFFWGFFLNFGKKQYTFSNRENKNLNTNLFPSKDDNFFFLTLSTSPPNMLPNHFPLYSSPQPPNIHSTILLFSR